MIDFIINAIKIIFLLGFLIFIHEGGHFLVAKLCKVKVIEFAIGFGPTIWKKQGKETKYALRLIPLGGFVNLEGEEQRVDTKTSFSNASIPKRMAIIVAGATVNIIFALVVYFILSTSLGNNVSNKINQILVDDSNQQTVLEVGDEILKINDKNINIKSDIDKIVKNSNGEKLNITVKRNGQEKDLEVIPLKKEYKSTGIYLKSTSNESSNKIVSLDKDSSGKKSGLQINDKIIKINNIEVKNSEDISNVIQLSDKNSSLYFTVKRGKDELEIEVIPDTMYTYYLGIKFDLAENNLGNNIYYSIFKTRDFIANILDNLKQLFTGNVGIDQMMGPVGISEVVVSTTGFSDFIYLMALISLSLGITNLLPFPALDGGKFVLLILELIRGKKLKEKTEINLQLFGFAILIALSIYVTYNDILRIF